MTSTTSSPPTRPGGSSDDTQPLPVGAASHPGPGTLRYGRDPFPPGPAAAGHDGHGTAGLTERLGRRWLAGWGSVAHLLLNLPLGALWLVVPILVAVGVVTIPAAGVGIIVILAAIWIAAAIAWVERHRVRALLGADVRGARVRRQRLRRGVRRVPRGPVVLVLRLHRSAVGFVQRLQSVGRMSERAVLLGWGVYRADVAVQRGEPRGGVPERADVCRRRVLRGGPRVRRGVLRSVGRVRR